MWIAIFCFCLATAIGAWRQSCAIYEIHLPYNCPSAWMNPAVRIVTWMITATLAVISAYVFADLIRDNIGDFVGKFSFGVILVTRWFLSSAFGGMPAYSKSQEIMSQYTSNSTTDDQN